MEKHFYTDGSGRQSEVSTTEIMGVFTFTLWKFADERGEVKHIIPHGFPSGPIGQIYVSTVRPGIVKAWHYHREMDLTYVCTRGMIKLVLYDGRDGSPTLGKVQELFIGERNYVMVHIPKNIWNGFKGISEFESEVINVASTGYSDKDIVRAAYDANIIDGLPYDWNKVNG